jgi:starch synthase (maltosyl-transferring)
VTVTDERLIPKKTANSNTSKSVQRTVIESVLPEIDGGRFPITRTPGEVVTVSADIFADGHDVIDAALQYRKDGDADWQFEPMRSVMNDRWQAQFRAGSVGTYFYTLRGWVDRFKTWARDLGKKADAGQDLSLDLMTGAQFLTAAAKRASPADIACAEGAVEKDCWNRCGGCSGVFGR